MKTRYTRTQNDIDLLQALMSNKMVEADYRLYPSDMYLIYAGIIYSTPHGYVLTQYGYDVVHDTGQWGRMSLPDWIEIDSESNNEVQWSTEGVYLSDLIKTT